MTLTSLKRHTQRFSKATLLLAVVPTAGIALICAVICGGCSDQAETSLGTAGASAGGMNMTGTAGTTAGAGGAGAAIGGSAGASAGSPGAGSGAGGEGGAGSGAGGASGVGGSAGSAGASAGGGGGAAPIDHNAPGVIVVLGSSTAAGTGPKDPKNAWVERYRAYLKTNFPKFVLTNIAVGGFSTYNMQPSDYVPPAGGPAKPDTGHNISKALSLKPNAIVINMPTNDTEYGYSAAVQLANFDRVTALAAKNGVSCWVTTSQPRNFSKQAANVIQAKHLVLFAVRDAINQKYGDHALDLWTGFADAEGNIKAIYSAGDGTHMNDEAHALIANVVIAAKIPEAILAKGP